MADLRTMKIEMTQDTRRQIDHLTRAVEGLTKAVKDHKDGDVTFYADNNPYIVRGDEDGFLEPVLHAKIDEEQVCIKHDDVLYFKWCGEPVQEEDTLESGDPSCCVLPEGHGGMAHMDWDGILKAREL